MKIFKLLLIFQGYPIIKAIKYLKKRYKPYHRINLLNGDVKREWKYLIIIELTAHFIKNTQV
jgi:hypothetical protein